MNETVLLFFLAELIFLQTYNNCMSSVHCYLHRCNERYNHRNECFFFIKRTLFAYYVECREQGQKFVLFLKIYCFLGTMSQPNALF